MGAFLWLALRKDFKHQCSWFRLTHFIWKSPGEGEEETGNYTDSDKMGQPAKLPGPTLAQNHRIIEAGKHL